MSHLNVLLSGDLYFEKAVNGFLSDLFAKWKVCDFYLSASVVTLTVVNKNSILMFNV